MPGRIDVGAEGDGLVHEGRVFPPDGLGILHELL